MMMGDVIMKGFKFIILILTVFLTASCSEDPKNEHFKTKDLAMDDFIDDQNIQGNIKMITTTKKEKLLVAKSMENSYLVGELNKTNQGFSAERISDNVQLEMGGSWPLITKEGNKYTIIFETTNEPGFVQLFNEEYFVSLVKENEKSNMENVIEDIEVMK